MSFPNARFKKIGYGACHAEYQHPTADFALNGHVRIFRHTQTKERRSRLCIRAGRLLALQGAVHARERCHTSSNSSPCGRSVWTCAILCKAFGKDRTDDDDDDDKQRPGRPKTSDTHDSVVRIPSAEWPHTRLMSPAGYQAAQANVAVYSCHTKHSVGRAQTLWTLNLVARKVRNSLQEYRNTKCFCSLLLSAFA